MGEKFMKRELEVKVSYVVFSCEGYCSDGNTQLIGKDIVTTTDRCLKFRRASRYCNARVTLENFR